MIVCRLDTYDARAHMPPGHVFRRALFGSNLAGWVIHMPRNRTIFCACVHTDLPGIIFPAPRVDLVSPDMFIIKHGFGKHVKCSEIASFRCAGTVVCRPCTYAAWTHTPPGHICRPGTCAAKALVPPGHMCRPSTVFTRRLSEVIIPGRCPLKGDMGLDFTIVSFFFRKVF